MPPGEKSLKMEKRLPRQRLQRIAIVPPTPPPPAEATEILIELDEGTLRRVDSLVERVKAGDVSPAFTRHLKRAPR